MALGLVDHLLQRSEFISLISEGSSADEKPDASPAVIESRDAVPLSHDVIGSPFHQVDPLMACLTAM